ncbi:MAG: HAMP domain-containing sensor histidine kinase [Pseudomonadota bacterium]
MTRLKALFRLSALRQALVLLGLFLFISLIAWGGTYLLVWNEMLRAVDGRLSERMEAAETALAAGQPIPLPDLGETAELVDSDRQDGLWTDPEQGNETRYFQRQTPFGIIRLSENTERQEELRDILSVGMRVSLLGCLAVAGLAGVWMARRTQLRLNKITNGLAAVAQGQLSTRIEVVGHDDLSLVAGRINSTTERLEQAMLDMRVQSSNIAHDLRTPLARLRAQIETAQYALIEDGQAVSEVVLETALDQIDRITGTFEALLRLSRIESGAGREGFATVEMGTLIEDVAEMLGPVIEEAGQTLEVNITNPAVISGDRDMLFQLLANLIQNALRYGSKGQRITLRCHDTLLSVSDQGQGIPFADRDRVLQPLYQGETTRQGEGFGLGLSLVRAIAELHGAELSLADGPNGRGLSATVRFQRLTKL